jgi:hypothetical protein
MLIILYLRTVDPRHAVLPAILSGGHTDFNFGYVYFMSLGKTFLQPLKESVLSQSPGASHTNSSSHHLIRATCSININSNFIVSYTACVTLAWSLLMASKDPKMGKKGTAGNMMHATSTVTEKLEMISSPKVTKIKRQIMTSYVP